MTPPSCPECGQPVTGVRRTGEAYVRVVSYGLFGGKPYDERVQTHDYTGEVDHADGTTCQILDVRPLFDAMSMAREHEAK